MKNEVTHSGRIPSLDGWRGIAILLVLLDHVQIALVGRYRWSWTETGQHGVTIFFVLSGFLITSKLLERQINLRDFYMRRFFRLMPAAWTYLAVIALLTLASGTRFTSIADVRACLLFYRNFVRFAHNSVTGHFWSLSLEEQFYLVWPSVLLLAGLRHSRWIAGGGAVACALYRWVFWAHYDSHGPNFQSQVRADALLLGCLVALLLAEPRLLSACRRLSQLLALPALAVFIYCIVRFHNLLPLSESAAIAILIAACVLHPGSLFVRILSFRPLAWLGVISYSVYLWQELFIHLGSGTGAVHLVSIFIAIPAFALASYYFIERPCIRFGNRLIGKRFVHLPETITPTLSESL
ncbi:MAG TPA: acyltransferase [Acidobacteriaceae bacterium]|nr:acyltransferase [Acidobacteriaceae bacterium]